MTNSAWPWKLTMCLFTNAVITHETLTLAYPWEKPDTRLFLVVNSHASLVRMSDSGVGMTKAFACTILFHRPLWEGENPCSLQWDVTLSLCAPRRRDEGGCHHFRKALPALLSMGVPGGEGLRCGTGPELSQIIPWGTMICWPGARGPGCHMSVPKVSISCQTHRDVWVCL